ncbi:MAG: endolytic transglycosylase MltG [Solirubrobacteraceae bacterium]
MSGRRGRGRGERSEADRRQARLEREQRRARREGRPIPERFEDLPGPGASGDPALGPADATRPADPARPVDPAGPAEGDRPAGADGPAGGAPAADAAASGDPAPRADRTGPVADASRAGDPPLSGSPVPVDWFGHTDPATVAPGAEPAASDPGSAERPPRRDVTADPAEPGATGASRRSREPERRRRAADPADRTDSAGRDDAGGRTETRRRRATGPGPSPGPAEPTTGRAAEARAARTSKGRGTGKGPTTGKSPKPKRRGFFRRRREPEPVLTHSGRPALVPAHTPDLSPRTAPARRGFSRVFAVLVLVPIVLVVAGYVVLFQPFKGEGSGTVEVRIQPGTSVDDIGKLLEERGVIGSGFIFAVRARLGGAGGRLRAGTIRLRNGMSYSAALDALQQDPLPPAVVTIALPEGLSRREAATVARKAGVTGSYLSASSKHDGFNPRRYGQPSGTKGLEGFLFPATYELPRGGSTAEALVSDQLDTFATEIRKIDMKRARKAKLNRYDVITIASLVEREVSVPSERAHVAAVIYNRLKRQMPLGIDATIRYAERNWTRPLRQSELDRPGPYNTRLRTGLPPTPIGSPGLEALKAAAAPSSSKALYYVVRPCGNGRHNFSSSDDQFQRDAAYYRSEQKRVGGDPANATGCAKR